MKRSSYGERDYAFGQTMLRLRMRIGLTQARLAEQLGVSRQAVGEWEAGLGYPKAEHLQALIALGIQQQAWEAGREEEEIRALWRAAHQKMLLDESRLDGLLRAPAAPREEVAGDQNRGTDTLSAPTASRERRFDIGEAPDIPRFYGREEELALLSQWIGEERCRLVSVLGLGGIGKSALAVTVMHRVAEDFEVVIWRSLRDAPSCEALVEEYLQVLRGQHLRKRADSLEGRLRRLLEELRAQRVLLVLDNLEVLLAEGEGTGRMRAGFEEYAQLLRSMGETAHQSCLLLTSREKPAELVPLEGSRSPVRALRLAGLTSRAGAELLAEQDVMGSSRERERLVERYRGNPLALKIVARTIVELFGGEIAPFLEQGEVVFGGVRELLAEQFERLSGLEQSVLFWMATLREPVTLEELQAGLVAKLSPVQLLEAVDSLHRRSLVERGQRPGSFTLQSVVLEYVSERLVSTASEEIVQGRLRLLREQSLSQAQARDYVRQTQERLLAVPLLARFQSSAPGRVEVEQRLGSLLEEVRSWAQDRQEYAPANLVTLLRLRRGNLRGLDLSRLVLRGVSLQGVEMQDANLSGALLQESIFTETFDAITAVAISPDGQSWAEVGKRGEVRVWEGEQKGGQTLHLVWQAHTDVAYGLAFSPGESTLASGSIDGSLKLWDFERGALRWSGWHPGIQSLVFAPDGSLLASGGLDATVRLWDPKRGTLLQELPHPGAVFALAWSPDGHLLASGDFVGTIRLWQRQPTGLARCIQTLAGHSSWVRGLAFAPDGSVLASASWDGTVKLWEVGEEGGLRVRQALVGHTDKVQCVAWSPDGRTLASGSHDHTIRLWDSKEDNPRAVLQGHSAAVYSLAFMPDGRSLLSGSDDGTLRLWDVESFELLHILQGYAAALFAVDWSPDGTRLASAGSESVVSIWEVEHATLLKVLYGHGSVYVVAWSPDGKLLASSALDSAVHVWDASTGEPRQTLRDPDHVDTLFDGLAWSPDGKLLAGGTSRNGVQVWEMTTGSRHWARHELSTWVRHLAWSPDGTRLVGGGDDGQVYVWDGSGGTLLQRLAGHQGVVTSVAWSPDGSRLASVGRSRGSGELVVWDTQRWQPIQALAQQGGAISAADWSPDGSRLVSGSSDGRLCWWQVESGQCLRERQGHTGTIRSLRSSPHGYRLASCGDDGAIRLWDLESGEPVRTLRRDRPYERLNITGIRGLSEAQKASLRALGAFEETSVGR